MTAAPVFVTRSEPPITDIHASSEEVLDLDSVQSFSGRGIDSRKLTSLLTFKFGAGTYTIHASILCKDKRRMLTVVRSCRIRTASLPPGNFQL